MSLPLIDLTGDDDPISLQDELTPNRTFTEMSQPKKETSPSEVPNLESIRSTSPARLPRINGGRRAGPTNVEPVEEHAGSHDSGIGESLSGSEKSMGERNGLEKEGRMGIESLMEDRLNSHAKNPTPNIRTAETQYTTWSGAQGSDAPSKKRKMSNEELPITVYASGFMLDTRQRNARSEYRPTFTETLSAARPTRSGSMTLHIPRPGSSKFESHKSVPPARPTSNPTIQRGTHSLSTLIGRLPQRPSSSPPSVKGPDLTKLDPVLYQKPPEPITIAAESNSESSFPPGFDRGCFPDRRRRRGGAKYGTPQKGGFPPRLSDSTTKRGRKSQRASATNSVSASSTPRLTGGFPRFPAADNAPISVQSSQTNFHQGVSGFELNLGGEQSQGRRGSDDRLELEGQIAVETNTRPDFILSADERSALDAFFAGTIYPTIKKQKKSHKGRLSESNLVAIDKSVAGDVIDEGFITFFRNYDLEPDRTQRKSIKKLIGLMYAHKVESLVQRLSAEQTPPFVDTKDTIPWFTLPAKRQPSDSVSVPRVTQRAPSPPLATYKYRSEVDDQTEKKAGSYESRITNLASNSMSSADKIQLADILPARPRDPSKIKPLGTLRSGPSTMKPLGILRSKPSTIQPQETYRSKLRTRFDPHLELIASKLALNTTQERREDRAGKRQITQADQQEVIEKETVLKHVDITGSTFTMVKTRIADPVSRPERSIASLLRHRELGSSSRGRNVSTHSELRLQTIEQLRPWRTWKGASSDVVTVAWAPDSMTYAVGAAAHTNVEDLQYNRPCNLLLGELMRNSLQELPGHWVDRPKPETINSGPNSVQETYNACDPKVYQTVESVAFSPTGDRMYSASHDHNVKIWDVPSRRCTTTLKHEANVTSVDVSTQHHGLFASASHCINDSIRVYYPNESQELGLDHILFSSPSAVAKPKCEIYPECIRWGPSAHTSHLLLAGFSQWAELSNDLGRAGQLCIWDVTTGQSIKVMPSSQSVSSAVWHPTLSYFATGGAPGGGALADKRGTKTVVRTWDVRTSTRYTMEYECPALDMVDVTFHPQNSNIVTAGYTDRTSYVWDFRWPNAPLHHLCHGPALNELDRSRSPAEADTGVCMSLWGLEGSLYYSGSSDGVIKAWDIRRHPEDVLVRDVAHLDAGVQNGAFSPDFTNLLVGDAAGGIHILSSVPYGMQSNNNDPDDDSDPATIPIEIIRAPDGSGKRLLPNDDNPGTEGIEAAYELLASSQVELNSDYGVGQGLNYNGPFAIYARKEPKEDGQPGRLRKRFDKQQPFSRKGEHRPENASKVRALADERRFALSNKPQDMPQTQSARPLGAQDSRSGDVLSGSTRRQLPTKSSFLDKVEEARMQEMDQWWPRLGEEEIENARRNCGNESGVK